MPQWKSSDDCVSSGVCLLTLHQGVPNLKIHYSFHCIVTMWQICLKNATWGCHVLSLFPSPWHVSSTVPNLDHVHFPQVGFSACSCFPFWNLDKTQLNQNDENRNNQLDLDQSELLNGIDNFIRAGGGGLSGLSGLLRGLGAGREWLFGSVIDMFHRFFLFISAWGFGTLSFSTYR